MLPPALAVSCPHYTGRPDFAAAAGTAGCRGSKACRVRPSAGPSARPCILRPRGPGRGCRRAAAAPISMSNWVKASATPGSRMCRFWMCSDQPHRLQPPGRGRSGRTVPAGPRRRRIARPPAPPGAPRRRSPAPRGNRRRSGPGAIIGLKPLGFVRPCCRAGRSPGRSSAAPRGRHTTGRGWNPSHQVLVGKLSDRHPAQPHQRQASPMACSGSSMRLQRRQAELRAQVR